MQITLLAVVTILPAFAPKAVLPLPVLLMSALTPMAVFKLPVALVKRALIPTAVLLLPVVLLKQGDNASGRVVVCRSVLLKSALPPVAVFCVADGH